MKTLSRLTVPLRSAFLNFWDCHFRQGLEIPRPAIEKQATRISKEWAASYLKLKKTKTGSLARIIRHLRF
jgi:hypothetical protein